MSMTIPLYLQISTSDLIPSGVPFEVPTTIWKYDTTGSLTTTPILKVAKKWHHPSIQKWSECVTFTGQRRLSIFKITINVLVLVMVRRWDGKYCHTWKYAHRYWYPRNIEARYDHLRPYGSIPVTHEWIRRTSLRNKKQWQRCLL